MADSIRVGWQHRVLGVQQLWDLELHGRGVRVAVLDSGLAAVAGLKRQHFESLDADGEPTDFIDVDGHGTCAASVVASTRNGALGIAPRALISSYRVLDGGNLPSKVRRAFDHILGREDIDIVLCAFIMPTVEQELVDKIRELALSGVLVVAAAGNSREVPSAFPERTPHVITVTGVTPDGEPLPGAQTGMWIDIAAPGKQLAALNPAGDVVAFADTSGAAAVVAGVAALLLSSQTTVTRRRKLGLLLDGMVRATARRLPHAPPGAVGSGLINPRGILNLIQEGV